VEKDTGFTCKAPDPVDLCQSALPLKTEQIGYWMLEGRKIAYTANFTF
jgi:hypothetical protein